MMPTTFGTPVWTERVDPATNQPIQPVSVFPDTVERITLAVPVENFRAEANLTAIWSFNGVQLEGFDTRVSADQDLERGWIEVHLERQTEGPWPDGEYRVDLIAGEEVISTAVVAVERT